MDEREILRTKDSPLPFIFQALFPSWKVIDQDMAADLPLSAKAAGNSVRQFLRKTTSR